MAKYKMEIEEDKITKTLTFLGKEFTEVWEEEGRICPVTIEAEALEAFPDLDEEYITIIEGIDCMSEDEVMEAVQTLTIYEQCQEEL